MPHIPLSTHDAVPTVNNLPGTSSTSAGSISPLALNLVHSHNFQLPLSSQPTDSHDSDGNHIKNHPWMLRNGPEYERYGILLDSADRGRDCLEQAMENLRAKNLNWADDDGVNCLMNVCSSGDTRSLSSLLGCEGLELDRRDKNGYNALIYAVISGNPEVVQLLLPKMAIEDINRGDNDGRTALMHAMRSGNANMTKKLLEFSDLKLDLRDKNGNNALMNAISGGHIHTIELLLSVIDRRCINTGDNQGETAIMKVIGSLKAERDVMNLLLSVDGINVNTLNNNGESAFIYAIKRLKTESIGLLIPKTELSIINAITTFDENALLLAVKSGNLDIVTQLLNIEGIDVTVKDKDGKTALMSAAFFGHAEIVEKLFTYCKDVNHINAVDNTGKTALMYAAIGSKFSIIKKMMTLANIDATAVDQQRKNALLHLFNNDASLNSPQQIEAFRALVDQGGININAIYARERTALHMAIDPKISNHFLEILLSFADVNVNAVDKKGNAALHLASEERVDFTRLLLNHPGININICNHKGRTPLYQAAYCGNPEVVKKLLTRRDININIPDKTGNTPLMAAENRLVEKDLDPLIKPFYADFKDKGIFSHKFKFDDVTTELKKYKNAHEKQVDVLSPKRIKLD